MPIDVHRDVQDDELPGISIVIIGLDAARYIGGCIEAIGACDYPRHRLELVYVDGGSSDGSAGIAQGYPGVKVVELTHPSPSPGRGRNAGVRASSWPLLQLLDVDTYLDRAWFKTAIRHLERRVAAVTGALHERDPNRNCYHRVADYDWRVAAGREGPTRGATDVSVFGGNVLLRREAFEAAGGFDESIVVGEEADLSYRIRHEGWLLRHIDEPMATHDIAMDSFRAYNRRAMRSGYAYAQTAGRFWNRDEKLFLQRLIRIVVSGTAPVALLAVGSLLGLWPIGVTAAALVFLRPMRKVPYFCRRYSMSAAEGCAYGLHLSYVVYPQLFGVIRYFAGRMVGRPLRNRLRTTATTSP